MIGAIIYAQQSSRINGDRARAILLLDEAMEAMRSIRSDSWNEIILNQSGLEQSGGEWNFIGEGSTESIDKFSRKVELMDVCRNGSDQIVDCPGTYLDVDTKQVKVTINWEARPGIVNTLSDTMYITNWMTKEWSQTDWGGGAGQSIWVDPSRYDSFTGSLDLSTSGEVKVGACPAYTWGFDTPANYIYDSNKIEVVSSNAQLKIVTDGTINKSLIDSLEFDTSDGRDNFIIHVAGNVYAVAYRGSGNDGFINTMEILPDGSISNSRIDYLEFDTSSGYEPSVINVSGDVYAIAYRGSGNDGFVRTVSINSSGQISNSIIDSLEFDTSNGYYPKIIKVGDGMFAVAYMGSGNDGFISTISINASGAIGNSVIDTYEFDTVNGSYPDIINISGTVYAITYTGNGNDGFVVTLNISTNGVITHTSIDSLEFINDDAYDTEVINVVNDIYAVVYRATSSFRGYISTFQIQSNGDIGNSSIDTEIFDSVYAYYPEIRKLDNKLFGVVYQGSGDDGYISTLMIEDGGTIQLPLIDTYEYDTTNGTEPDLIQISGNIFAVAYAGSASDGFVSTLTINLSHYPTDKPTINPVSSFQNSAVGAWSTFTEIANKNGGQIYYQLSDDDGVTWNYWSGSAWTAAGATNYNDASTVNTNINSFIATTKKISFKAFLESNGSQLVQLDSIKVECNSSSPGFIDDTQIKFDLGIYNMSQWNVANSWIDLTGAGKTAGAGDYTSSIKDARATTTWSKFSWLPTRPSMKELPNNTQSETAYSAGNVNMSGNVLLMHMNSASGLIQDFSGLSNTGTNVGATYGVSGRYNTAMQFDGSSNYIDIPNSASLNPANTLTLEAWVRWNIVPSTGNSWAQIIDKNGDNGYQIQHSSGNSAFEFALQTSSARTYIIGTTAPVQGIWYHVVGVYDGSTIKIYVNGNLEGTNNLTGTILTNTSNVNIGRRTSNDRYFNGVIDEVAIYNRALSQPEILDRFMRGGVRARFQVRSCNNPACTGATFIGPDGTAATYYSELNNPELGLPDISLIGVPSNRYFQYKIFFETNNSAYSPEIRSVTVNKSGGSGGGTSTGTLYSSAFNTGGVSNFASLEWSQTILSCPLCNIKLQVRGAADNAGNPGIWTDWSGPGGVGTFYTANSGTVIPALLNGNQWIQYKVDLTGDGNNSPSFEEIRIKYK